MGSLNYDYCDLGIRVIIESIASKARSYKRVRVYHG